MNWIRENYGWKAKRDAWLTLAFCLILAVGIVGLLMQAG